MRDCGDIARRQQGFLQQSYDSSSDGVSAVEVPWEVGETVPRLNESQQLLHNSRCFVESLIQVSVIVAKNLLCLWCDDAGNFTLLWVRTCVRFV